jgi:hypothetical protein
MIGAMLWGRMPSGGGWLALLSAPRFGEAPEVILPFIEAV